MNQEQLSKENNSFTTEVALQATSAIDVDRQPIFGYDGLTEVLLMGAATVVGFKILYRKSILYLDRIHPLQPNIFQKLAQPKCKKCRFYNPNSDFQCSVHPVTLQFNEAKSCPDYWQRDRRKFLHR